VAKPFTSRRNSGKDGGPPRRSHRGDLVKDSRTFEDILRESISEELGKAEKQDPPIGPH
jgi:hypothetical protein